MGLLPIDHGVSRFDTDRCSNNESFDQPNRFHLFHYWFGASFGSFHFYSNVRLPIRTKTVVTHCLGSVDVNYIAVSERWGAKKIGNRVYITLDAFTLLIEGKNNPLIRFILINWASEGVVLFLTAPSPPWSISYMVTSSSCFSLANIRLVLVNLTAGRCLHAPYDAPPEFAKPRRVFGSLYTLKPVL